MQSDWLITPALVLTAVATIPTSVQATSYLSVAQSQKQQFPSATKFVASELTLSDDMIDKIEELSQVRVKDETYRIWKAYDKEDFLGWFIMDRVVGKHEYITYALAVKAEGTLLGLDILVYRETHGSEIKNRRWQAQFLGKNAHDELKLDSTIVNISGATLSCKNLTNGVKRILATVEIALK